MGLRACGLRAYVDALPYCYLRAVKLLVQLVVYFVPEYAANGATISLRRHRYKAGSYSGVVGENQLRGVDLFCLVIKYVARDKLPSRPKAKCRIISMQLQQYKGVLKIDQTQNLLIAWIDIHFRGHQYRELRLLSNVETSDFFVVLMN